MEMRIAAVVPTYNNPVTLGGVARGAASWERIEKVVVVLDGSGEATRQAAEAAAATSDKIDIIGYTPNKGKGYALGKAFAHLRKAGFTHAVTLDADGQHFTEDIGKFIAAMDEDPEALWVGARDLNADGMPGKNTFANRFSNFWLWVQTGQRLPDTQSGFRAYPLKRMGNLRPVTRRYEAEVELPVRAAWRGIRLRAVGINVTYAPEGGRVSFFRPGRDFARISALNTCLCVGAVVYGYPRMAVRMLKKKMLG